MARLGKRNLLLIRRDAAPGFYLDGGDLGEILLPHRYIPEGAAPGDSVSVFLYRDSEDRLIATTERPYAEVGQFAYLRVVGIAPGVGAFLDWGLTKDLFLPIREQARPIQENNWVVVYILLDEQSNRILASTRLERWLDLQPATYARGESVQLLVDHETPLGYSAIINQSHRGLLYRTETGESLAVGQPLTGYVREVRPDGKIDLTLDAIGYGRIASLTGRILESLGENGGYLALHDQSPPEAIREAFGVSKKAYKQAVGALYRQKRLTLEPQGIRLLP